MLEAAMTNYNPKAIEQVIAYLGDAPAIKTDNNNTNIEVALNSEEDKANLAAYIDQVSKKK